jgi:hypothetical protein
MQHRILVALVATGVLFAVSVPTASAECFGGPGGPLRATERPEVGTAFEATVTDASRNVDPGVPEMSAFDWHVELKIDRTYVGHVPDTIVYDGWDAGCHVLRGDGLRTGDRIFVAVENLALEWLPRDPFDGDVIVWKATSGAWTFDQAALLWAFDPAYYPKSARNATTTAAILRLISNSRIPDTATLPPPGAPQQDRTTTIPLLMVALLILLMARRLPGSSPHDIHRR